MLILTWISVLLAFSPVLIRTLDSQESPSYQKNQIQLPIQKDRSKDYPNGPLDYHQSHQNRDQK